MFELDQGPAPRPSIDSVLHSFMDPVQYGGHALMQPLQVDPPAATSAPHPNPTTAQSAQPNTVVPSHTTAPMDPYLAAFTHYYSPSNLREPEAESTSITVAPVQEPNNDQQSQLTTSATDRPPQQGIAIPPYLSFLLDNDEYDDDDNREHDAAFQRLSMALAAGIEHARAAPQGMHNDAGDDGAS